MRNLLLKAEQLPILPNTTLYYGIFLISLAVVILILYICGVFGKRTRQKSADELENEELASQAKEMLKGFPKE